MSERWQEYFAAQQGRHHSFIEAAAQHWSYNLPLYQRIRRALPPPARVLDVGCGWGLTSLYLAGCGYRVTGVDNDAAIVELARGQADRCASDARFERADAHDLGRFHGGFDLTLSVGVLEHFDREQTVALLREQARCAALVLCVVPTRFTKFSGTITDERIYSLHGLKSLFAEAGLGARIGFGYGDVFSPLHRWVKRLLPHGAYRLLQERFSYAMDIGCIGRNAR